MGCWRSVRISVGRPNIILVRMHQCHKPLLSRSRMPGLGQSANWERLRLAHLWRQTHSRFLWPAVETRFQATEICDSATTKGLRPCPHSPLLAFVCSLISPQAMRAPALPVTWHAKVTKMRSSWICRNNTLWESNMVGISLCHLWSCSTQNCAIHQTRLGCLAIHRRWTGLRVVAPSQIVRVGVYHDLAEDFGAFF